MEESVPVKKENIVQIDPSDFKVAEVEASPPVGVKEEMFPVGETAMAVPAQEEIKEEVRLPDTIEKLQETIPMAAEVLQETSPVKIIVRVRSVLKVRAKPSINGEVVGSLKNNDIRVLVKEVEGWYKVEHIDGRTGWISQRYSHKIDDGSNIMNMIVNNHQVVSLL